MLKGIIIFFILAAAAFYFFYRKFDVKLAKALDDLAQKTSSLANKDMLDSLMKGNFNAVEAASKRLNNDELSSVSQVLLESDIALSICHKWSAEYPESAVANSFLGAALTTAAADARGAAVASQLTNSQIDTFVNYLLEAKSFLNKAIDLDSSISMNYTNLITVDLGLSDKKAAEATFEKARHYKADNFDTYLAMARLYTPKWLGSRDELLGFCKKYSQEQPDRLSGLVPYAHYELYVQELMNGNKKAINYLKSNTVKEFVNDAYKAVENKPANGELVKSFNQFAAVFTLVGDKLKAKAMFEKIGIQYTPFPWRYQQDNPAEAFLKARIASGLPAIIE